MRISNRYPWRVTSLDPWPGEAIIMVRVEWGISSTRNGHFPCQIVNKGRKCNLGHDHGELPARWRQVGLLLFYSTMGVAICQRLDNLVSEAAADGMVGRGLIRHIKSIYYSAILCNIPAQQSSPYGTPGRNTAFQGANRSAVPSWRIRIWIENRGTILAGEHRLANRGRQYPIRWDTP